MVEFTEVMKQRERMHKLFYRECNDCPVADVNNGHEIGCASFIFNFPQEAEAIIMKWADEHPAQTNADKFKEVFGAKVNTSAMGCCGIVADCSILCSDCEYRGFWKQEYKEPKEVE